MYKENIVPKLRLKVDATSRTNHAGEDCNL